MNESVDYQDEVDGSYAWVDLTNGGSPRVDITPVTTLYRTLASFSMLLLRWEASPIYQSCISTIPGAVKELNVSDSFLACQEPVAKTFSL